MPNPNPLKIARIVRRMTQSELAAATGISASMIAKLEIGARNMTAATAKKLTAALQCHPNTLTKGIRIRSLAR
jgi:transcriptional regulator with XRE-family HTH domain